MTQDTTKWRASCRGHLQRHGSGGGLQVDMCFFKILPHPKASKNLQGFSNRVFIL